MRLLVVVFSLLLFSSTSLAFESGDSVPGEVLVKFKSSKNQIITLGKVAASAQLKSKKSWPSLNLHQFTTKKGDQLEDVIKRLKEDPNVEFAEPNYYVRSSNMYFPMTSSRIKVPEAWEILSDPRPIDELPIIAVVDSGLDLSHSVYNSTDRVFVNEREIPGNGFDDDGNGFIDDVRGWDFISNSSDISDDTGHGTHVAGIVLGSTEDVINFNPNNSPKVRILPLKFLNSEGVGKTSDAVEAIDYAIEMGAKVINNSWGGPNYSSSLHSILTKAYNQGIVIVVAAGNSGTNNDTTPVYPAALNVPSLITVAASQSNNTRAFFSNVGVNTVHVFAPGVSVLSTIPGNSYGITTGTSMAAPFVSGLAGLIASEAPNLSGYQIKQLILDHGDSFPEMAQYSSSGNRINFLKTIQETQMSYLGSLSFQPEYEPVIVQSSRSMSSTEEFGSTLGCGRIESIYKSNNKHFFKNSNNLNSNLKMNSINLLFMLLPLIFLTCLRFLNSDRKKRRFYRRKVDLIGQIVTAQGYVLPINVKDLSPGGAGLQLMDGHSEFKIDQTTDLVLTLIFGKGEKVRYKAKVRRCTEDGFLGVEFSKS